MTGDRGIRRLTAAAGRGYRGCGQFHPHPEPGRDARSDRCSCLASLGVSVDGPVGGVSLPMVWAARSGPSTPWLARCMLTLGMLATLGANIGYGAPCGRSGELLSGWPAVAFVGSVEMVLSMARRARTAPTTDTAVSEVAAGLNGHADRTAELFAADLAAGNVPGMRPIRRGMPVG